MTYSLPNFWTAERTTTLRTMAANHSSANQIAFEIGCGITRNAVCGKAYRIGVQLSGSNRGARTNRTSRKGIPKPRQRGSHVPVWALAAELRVSGPEVVELVVEPSTALNVAFVDLESQHCRWPNGGDPGPAMMCCGAPRADGRSYCEWHCRIAYMPERRR